MSSDALSDRASPSWEGAAEARPQLVPQRRLGQRVAGAVAIVVIGCGIASLAMNPRLKTDVIGHYLFSSIVLQGVLVTIELTAIALVLGLMLGLLLALMRLSDNQVLARLSWLYTAVFRAVPPLLQLIFWAFMSALYPRIGLGIPGTDIDLFSVDTNHAIKPFVAAVIAFTLIEAAYAAEAIRGGLMSVDQGQRQAAMALGLSSRQIVRKIVIPQAMPAIVPPLGNNAIVLLKSTSLVSVIGTADLMTTVQRIYSQTYQVIPLLAVAGVWYVVLVSLMSYGQYHLERHYAQEDRA